MRTALLALAAVLPARWTPWVLRTVFGYRIGRGVRIGFSLIDVGSCEIGDGTSIGHGNLFIATTRLRIGSGTLVGHLNIFRGGDEVTIGSNTKVLRLNVVNSMRDPVAGNSDDQRFSLGDGSALTEGHRIDFTGGVAIGASTVLAGRHTSLWTHARDEYGSVEIGDLCFIGSEARFSPGSRVPDRTVVGMGAVVVDSFDTPGQLIAGVPAQVVGVVDAGKSGLLRAVGEGRSRALEKGRSRKPVPGVE